jgi:hypothetical protein
MPFPHDKEKTKLIERLQKELPPNVEFTWDAVLNTLTFQTSDKKLLLNIKYGCPEYPESNDADFYLRRIKSILSKS